MPKPIVATIRAEYAGEYIEVEAMPTQAQIGRVDVRPTGEFRVPVPGEMYWQWKRENDEGDSAGYVRRCAGDARNRHHILCPSLQFAVRKGGGAWVKMNWPTVLNMARRNGYPVGGE